MAIRSRIAQQAYDLALPYVEELGLELVDVEYKKEGSLYYLRVYVDKKGGVSIEDCENVSRALDPIFDSELKADPDFFEVSSPGLTRPLQTQADFIRYIGEEVEISLYCPREGSKSLVGTILRATEDTVIFVSALREISFHYDELASVKRIIKF